MPQFTFTEAVEVETYHCSQCGILYGAPKSYFESKRQDGESFYCPNGHSLSFGHSSYKRKLEAAQRELAQKQAELAAANARVANERAARELREREIARQKTRSRNGVCPCCTRSFTNLRRHMAAKHPEAIA